MVHAVCVFAASIHMSRTWMSGSFESMQLNACVHRLDLSLYSPLKEFWGYGVRAHVNSKGKKSPLLEKFSSRRIKPTRQHQAGQREAGIAQLLVLGLAVHSVAGSILLWGHFPVEGIFPLELTWVQTPFPQKLLRIRV